MEVRWGLFDEDALAITGSGANTTLKIRREADGFLFDFDDSTFKALEWVALTAVLSEIDGTNFAGYYKKDIDVSAWDDGRYLFVSAHTVAPKQNGELDITIADGVVAERESTINVLSAIDGALQIAYASDGGTTEVVRGDTVSIPYNLTVDMTSKRLYFAAKKKAGDPTYSIAVKEITSSISDAGEGQGVIPLLSAELGIADGDYAAEVEMRDSDGLSNPITVLKFTLRNVEQVIV